tara:strand:+ start:1 stop:1092 length:1092 start_codon:yes stop_codon:yes gene_type:complete
MQILKLRIMQRCGQKPIALVGGGTTKIGDPSGKDKTRSIRAEKEINDNISRIKDVLKKFLRFGDSKTDALLIDNSQWLDKLNYIDFLREIGSHFTVNRMLTYDSIKSRLDREQPLSFIEFNYMVLQAYDFFKLNEKYNCVLQMGGSDQWGNILNGIELCRRMASKEVYGLTSDLLTTSTGSKMGKTAEGAIWLSEDMTSPYNYWNYWRNTHDDDVPMFLRIFTDLKEDEIIKLEKLQDSEINDAKVILANEATKMCHGAEKALESEKTSFSTFVEGEYGNSLPTLIVKKREIESGIPIFELIKRAFNLSSGGEARRILRSGSVKMNDEKIKIETYTVLIDNFDANGIIKLSIGKKRHSLIRLD